ncbi:MAG: TraR/DksA C4-type zinc finger protein, partial [Sedimentisphaerales bacterium]
YGVCEGDGEPIPKPRLEAIPWARSCVRCATLIEKGLLAAREEDDSGPPDFGEPDDDDES